MMFVVLSVPLPKTVRTSFL